MQVETRPMLRISGASEWFKDPEFIEWINAPGTATWHHSGEPPDEYSDVFTHVQAPTEGSDEPGYGQPSPPQHIWDEICRLVEEHLGDGAEALVWISNEVE